MGTRRGGIISMAALAALAALAAVATVATLVPGAGAQAPADPVRADETLQLEPFAALPGSAGRRMMELVQPPGIADELYVTVEEGQIWRMSTTGVVEPTPFLDLATSNLAGQTDGANHLRYIAFHPDYARPGRPGFGKLYISVKRTVVGTPDDDTDDLIENLTGDFRHAWTVVEWTVPDPLGAATVDSASGRDVLRLHYRTPSVWAPHGITDIAFDPALTPGQPGYGLLYISSGDSGDGGPVVDGPYAQRLDNLFGKILRIDPLQNGASAYTVPASNPYVGTGGARGEIFAYGLRNPQNLSFEILDGTSRLVASDIGYDSAEEVNIIRAGDNYGWDAREGTEPENATPVGTNGTLRGPVAVYDHTLPSNQIDAPAVPTTGGTAIVGGQIYRGSRAPRMAGQYIFGDIPRGRFFTVHEDDLVAAFGSGNPAPVEELLVEVGGTEVLFPSLIGSPRGDARFGRDASGEIYVLNKTDRIIRRLAVDPTRPAPTPDEPTVVPSGSPLIPARCAHLGPLNLIRGTDRDDVLIGTDGNDLILAGRGNDVVRARGGDDCIVARPGNDRIFAGRGNDVVIGGRGRDRIHGGPGHDRLFGGPGNDVLRGGRGNDLLVGGPGIDRCVGGPGDDRQRSCE